MSVPDLSYRLVWLCTKSTSSLECSSYCLSSPSFTDSEYFQRFCLSFYSDNVDVLYLVLLYSSVFWRCRYDYLSSLSPSCSVLLRTQSANPGTMHVPLLTVCLLRVSSWASAWIWAILGTVHLQSVKSASRTSFWTN